MDSACRQLTIDRKGMRRPNRRGYKASSLKMTRYFSDIQPIVAI